MSDDKWKKLDSPPPPMFLGEKEKNLVKQVNDEIVERVVGQQLLYFPIDIDHTNFHPLYGEAMKKLFFLQLEYLQELNTKELRLIFLKMSLLTKKLG